MTFQYKRRDESSQRPSSTSRTPYNPTSAPRSEAAARGGERPPQRWKSQRPQSAASGERFAPERPSAPRADRFNGSAPPRTEYGSAPRADRFAPAARPAAQRERFAAAPRAERRFDGERPRSDAGSNERRFDGERPPQRDARRFDGERAPKRDARFGNGDSRARRFERPAPSAARAERRDRVDSAPPLVSANAPSSEEMTASPFNELGLAPQFVRAVLEAGYKAPTPIQRETIPLVLSGRDVLGQAQTGTGKTAAFTLPLLQRLGARGGGKVRALVLSPTRELAAQLGVAADSYGKYSGLSHTVIYGGVNQRSQERALARRPELLVATPGRLLDLMNQNLVDLGAVEILVLDEADTMLDMGFIHDVRRIVSKVPSQRQTLFFSATMPRPIEELARTILRDPLRVSVAPQVTTAERVEQAVYFVAQPDKRSLLQRVLTTPGVERALVFTRTKRGADRVAKALVQGGVEAAAIHGNKSQNARERALDGFRAGRTTVLVATDIAARGIDVQGVSHVINYDLPNVAESYVHRIGRTGRAGAAGQAISFCDRDERKLLVDIERLIRRRLPVADAQA